jgi:hypothetical protein
MPLPGWPTCSPAAFKDYSFAPARTRGITQLDHPEDYQFQA